MGLVSIFGSSFILGFSGAIMPGPLLALVLSGSYQVGFKAGPLTVIGHGIPELGVVLALGFGLGEFLKSDLVFQLISLIGGGMLIYLGWGMFRSLTRASELKKSTDLSFSRGNLVIKGLLTSVFNPYWLMWWATVGMALILSAAKYQLVGILVFFLGHILSDLIWYSGVSFALDRGKTFLSPAFHRGMIAVCGGVMIFFGLYFILGVV